MKRNLLFIDFDGVLSYGKFWSELHPDAYNNVSNFVFKENKELVKEWMRGKYSSEEIHRIICEELSLPYIDTFELFKQGCTNFQISEKLIAQLKKLKEQYYLILRTDNMDSFDRFTLPANKVLTEVFDEIHNSYQLGYLKLESNFYEDMAHQKGLKFSEATLIDDSPHVCEHFSRKGGKAINVTGVKNVLNTLITLGLVLGNS